MRHLSIKKFRLLGKSIQHSLSPLIHQLFAQQFGIQISYDLQEVEPADLSTAVTDFFCNGGSGINITAPYKELMFQQLANLDDNAQTARAVNTLLALSDGTICGSNTDGIGLQRDLDRNRVQISEKNLMLLGAGGAVRGILPQLLLLQPKAITLFNRDLIKAEHVRCDFGETIHVRPYNELSMVKADVIIHAISSNSYRVDPSLYKQINYKNTICYDLNYGVKSSIFLDIAQINGAKQVIDGLGMLVEQAAVAFNLWHNCTPDTNVVLKQIIGVFDKKQELTRL